MRRCELVGSPIAYEVCGDGVGLWLWLWLWLGFALPHLALLFILVSFGGCARFCSWIYCFLFFVLALQIWKRGWKSVDLRFRFFDGIFARPDR